MRLLDFFWISERIVAAVFLIIIIILIIKRIKDYKKEDFEERNN